MEPPPFGCHERVSKPRDSPQYPPGGVLGLRGHKKTIKCIHISPKRQYH